MLLVMSWTCVRGGSEVVLVTCREEWRWSEDVEHCASDTCAYQGNLGQEAELTMLLVISTAVLVLA